MSKAAQERSKIRSKGLILGLVLTHWASAGCSSKIDAKTVRGKEVEKPAVDSVSRPDVVIDALSVLAAKPGEVIAVSGSNLRSGMTVLVGGVLVELNVESATKATFVMPEGVNAGLVDVAFKLDTQDVKTLSLVSDSAGDDLPIMLVAPELVCQDLSFRNAKGDIKKGLRDCASTSLADCAQEGQTNCRANDLAKATIVADLAGKVAAGKMVAGVVGTVAVKPADCAADGDSSCVVRAPFVALQQTSLQAVDVRSGVTIAGVSGSLVVPTVGDVRQGVSFGGGSLLVGTLDPGGVVPPACSSDGGTGCVVGTGYAAAALAGLASKVLSTASVAGVTGNVTLPAVAQVRSTVQYGVGGTGSTGTLTLPAPSNVLASAGAYGIGGSGSTGTVVLPSVGDVRLAVGFGAGSALVGTLDPGAGVPGNCGSDGETNCVAITGFPAVDTSTLAGKVLSTATVAGVTGNVTVPAVGKVLASTQYGVGGNGLTGTLTLPAASNVLTGSGTYGDPGAAVTPSYSPDFPSVANVLSSATVNGASGTLTLPPANSVLASAGAYGVGGNGSTPTLTLPAVGKVLASTPYGVGGNGATGTLTLPSASNVLTGSGTYGDPGAAVTPSYSPDFPSVANVLSSATVNGANGTLTLPPANSVLASAGAFGVGGNGSTPTLTLPAVGKVLASTQYGVGGNGSTGTLTLPSASNVLTGSGTYGDPGSAVTPSYTPDFPAVGNVLSSDTVDGANGTLTLPPANSVLASAGAYGVGGNGSTPTLTLPVVGDVYTGIQYGVGGNGSTGTLTLAAAANVRTGQGAFGRSGSSVTPTLADCADAETGCVVVAGFKAADMSVVTAGNVKRGVTIAGVAGAFPSTAHPMPRFTDSGASANTAGDGGITTDLTNFITQLTTDGNFEFWDETGVRRTGAGDSDIVAANVKSTIEFENFSIVGSAPGGSNCTGDGQTGCLTTSRYKSMDTDSSVITEWDIRKGKTAGGLAGEITFYKNMANTALFNRTSGTGALAGLDIYDTVEDYNNNGAFPTENPGGWHQATGANWLRDPLSDVGGGGGTAGDGICNGTENCVYKDRISGLFWAKADATTRTWENAITYCDGLNGSSFGGYASGWRLPTQKELQQSYVNGVWSQKDAAKLNLQTNYYWSSSTVSTSTSDAWLVYLYYGLVTTNPKASTTYV